jgi:hypothetical protein
MNDNIIRESEQREKIHYSINFDRVGHEGGWGLEFDCDSKGVIDVDALDSAALENLRECLTGEVNGWRVQSPRFNSWVQRYTIPALMRCECRHKLELYAFTNTCEKCGRDYDTGGSLLAPRSQWGDDTGESLGEILDIGHFTG